MTDDMFVERLKRLRAKMVRGRDLRVGDIVVDLGWHGAHPDERWQVLDPEWGAGVLVESIDDQRPWAPGRRGAVSVDDLYTRIDNKPVIARTRGRLP